MQLYHLGSGRQRDDYQCDIKSPVIADEWAESTALVGNRWFAYGTFMAFWFGSREIPSTDEE